MGIAKKRLSLKELNTNITKHMQQKTRSLGGEMRVSSTLLNCIKQNCGEAALKVSMQTDERYGKYFSRFEMCPQNGEAPIESTT